MYSPLILLMDNILHQIRWLKQSNLWDVSQQLLEDCMYQPPSVDFCWYWLSLMDRRTIQLRHWIGMRKAGPMMWQICGSACRSLGGLDFLPNQSGRADRCTSFSFNDLQSSLHIVIEQITSIGEAKDFGCMFNSFGCCRMRLTKVKSIQFSRIS